MFSEKTCQLQEVDNMYLMLDPQLHPIPPDSSCSQSMQIFEEHKQVNKDVYLLKYCNN